MGNARVGRHAAGWRARSPRRSSSGSGLPSLPPRRPGAAPPTRARRSSRGRSLAILCVLWIFAANRDGSWRQVPFWDIAWFHTQALQTLHGLQDGGLPASPTHGPTHRPPTRRSCRRSRRCSWRSSAPRAPRPRLVLPLCTVRFVAIDLPRGGAPLRPKDRLRGGGARCHLSGRPHLFAPLFLRDRARGDVRRRRAGPCWRARASPAGNQRSPSASWRGSWPSRAPWDSSSWRGRYWWHWPRSRGARRSAVRSCVSASPPRSARRSPPPGTFPTLASCSAISSGSPTGPRPAHSPAPSRRSASPTFFTMPSGSCSTDPACRCWRSRSSPSRGRGSRAEAPAHRAARWISRQSRSLLMVCAVDFFAALAGSQRMAGSSSCRSCRPWRSSSCAASPRFPSRAPARSRAPPSDCWESTTSSRAPSSSASIPTRRRTTSRGAPGRPHREPRQPQRFLFGLVQAGEATRSSITKLGRRSTASRASPRPATGRSECGASTSSSTAARSSSRRSAAATNPLLESPGCASRCNRMAR